MKISFISKGSFDHTESFLKAMTNQNVRAVLEAYGQKGVVALSSATPVDTGLAAQSWTYEITQKGKSFTIAWKNTDIENGFPVVIMLQHGHGTGSGGYVQGRDFINPVLRPLFDQMSDELWKEVTSA